MYRSRKQWMQREGEIMRVQLSSSERKAVEEAARTTQQKRHWQRLRALVLLGEGRQVSEVARVLGTTRQSLYNWVARYQAHRGPESLRDRPRCGRPPTLDQAAGERLDRLLESDPREHGYQAHGWTVPLLCGHLEREWGCEVGQSALRSTLHARGWRWKRPRYVLSRKDPERERKKGS